MKNSLEKDYQKLLIENENLRKEKKRIENKISLLKDKVNLI